MGTWPKKNYRKMLISPSSFLGRVVYREGEAGGVRMQKKRRVLEWPPEAVEIATGEGKPIDKCAELIRVSGHERRYAGDSWKSMESNDLPTSVETGSHGLKRRRRSSHNDQRAR